MILRWVLFMGLFGLLVLAQEANNTAPSESTQKVQAPSTEDQKSKGSDQQRETPVESQSPPNTTDSKNQTQTETQKSAQAQNVTDSLNEKNSEEDNKVEQKEEKKSENESGLDASDSKNSTKSDSENGSPPDTTDSKNQTQTETEKSTTDSKNQTQTETEKSTPAQNVTEPLNEKNSEEENKVEKEEAKKSSLDANDKKNSTKTETEIKAQTNSTLIDNSSETNKNATESDASENESVGYEEFYENFSFDELFESDYDYLGYDEFGEEYFNQQDKEDDYYQSYYDYMYQDLYGDYNEYFYEDETYADYEYYGDYGYYGVYNEDGYMYGDYGGDYGNQDKEYDYLVDYFTFNEDFCQQNEKGEIILDVAMDICNVSISGADDLVQNMDGGLDGIYQLAGCENGRPKYVRYEKPGQERILWWSSVFGDWDITTGDEPNNQDILVYGSDTLNEERPNFVVSWHIAADILSQSQQNKTEEDYIPIDLKITCANGSQLVRPEHAQMGNQPLLTEEEMDFQYRMIYERYGKKDPPTPQINFSLVVVMVIVGMGVVLGIPYMMVKRRGDQHNSVLSKSREQAFNELRKKRVGKD